VKFFFIFIPLIERMAMCFDFVFTGTSFLLYNQFIFQYPTMNLSIMTSSDQYTTKDLYLTSPFIFCLLSSNVSEKHMSEANEVRTLFIQQLNKMLYLLGSL